MYNVLKISELMRVLNIAKKTKLNTIPVEFHIVKKVFESFGAFTFWMSDIFFMCNLIYN